MPSEPREFGPYKLIRRLGVGGMAETFEATRVGPGGFEQRVCVKRVLPAFSDDPTFVARFQREAMLAARLRHTHIVGVIDAGEIDGSHYMVLELVDGVDLRSFLTSFPDERLHPDVVTLIGLDLAYALEHAHATLIHRDVSPSNILLSRAGRAKLADFGVAKALEHSSETISRNTRGKMPYMAPEHIQGESIDGRADLFSLGVVLFECIAGARPFDGAHDVETMQRILRGERPRLLDVAEDTPEPQARVIERLLEIDVEARTPSASKLVEELAELAPPPSTRRELAEIIDEHRGGPEARLHVRAQDDDPDTELTRWPDPRPEARAPSPPARRRWLAMAALLATTGLAIAIGETRRPPTTPSNELATTTSNPAAHTDTDTDTAAGTGTDTTTDTAAGTAAGVDTAAGTGTGAATGAGTGTGTGTAPETTPTTQAETETETTPATETTTAAATATTDPARPPTSRLTVVVEPWGNVWIDDAFMGRAPLRRRLPKGRYVIGAGYNLQSQRRTIVIEPGGRKEIVFTLDE